MMPRMISPTIVMTLAITFRQLLPETGQALRTLMLANLASKVSRRTLEQVSARGMSSPELELGVEAGASEVDGRHEQLRRSRVSHLERKWSIDPVGASQGTATPCEPSDRFRRSAETHDSDPNGRVDSLVPVADEHGSTGTQSGSARVDGGRRGTRTHAESSAGRTVAVSAHDDEVSFQEKRTDRPVVPCRRSKRMRNVDHDKWQESAHSSSSP